MPKLSKALEGAVRQRTRMGTGLMGGGCVYCQCQADELSQQRPTRIEPLCKETKAQRTGFER